jgi:ssDNA-binding Zn-finger/Zn-ribbon topoisomerase 1
MRRVLVIFAFCLASVCYAGMERAFICRHCGLKGTYVQGGLMFGSQFVAFCPKDHFVHISWAHGKRAPKPIRFEAGIPVYDCPVCEKPIARKWDEKACPRCGSKQIKSADTGVAVD